MENEENTTENSTENESQETKKTIENLSEKDACEIINAHKFKGIIKPIGKSTDGKKLFKHVKLYDKEGKLEKEFTFEQKI